MSKKRPSSKPFSLQNYDSEHYKATQGYTKLVEHLLDKATADIASIANKEGYQGDKPFSFNDHPKTKAYVQRVIKRLAEQMQVVIEEGAKRQWLFACRKGDAFIGSIINTSKLSKDELEAMQGRNLDALQAFQARKVGGMDLSQRVWRYTQQFKEQIEVGLDVGLGEGRSAQELSRDLRQNLQDPNKLFRRVRDKRGNLQLSKAAKAFHPGRGIYRSSHKNALRLARSEINMAYRESDHLRWQQLDFVVGFEIRRSERKRYTECELCSKLVGKYPKTFRFKGWHPQCMCYVVPIMEDYNSKERSDDRKARLRAALNGTEYRKYSSKETIKDVPDAFKEWVANNVDKQSNWASAPYFVKDNFVDGDLSKGLAYLATPNPAPTPTILERAKARQAQRTPEDKQIIKDKWEERNRKFSNLNWATDVLQASKIEYREPIRHIDKLSDDKIISRLAGGDMTKGSCASLALAYAGNKAGLDVLDFRDGDSRTHFASGLFWQTLSKATNSLTSKDTNDYKIAYNLFKQAEENKEYILSIARHAAVVKKVDGKWYYLELQSKYDERNGFTPFTKDTLAKRFGAQKTHSMKYIGKYEVSGSLIDLEALKRDPKLINLLGYINTAETSQKKGKSGGLK